MKNEKPILFSGEMVQAILDGRKTQTRRNANDRIAKMDGATGGWFTRKRNCAHKWTSGLCAWENPYGNPGNRLWVKETFCQTDSGIAYRASTDSEGERCRMELGYKWKPSIFMPRQASRILLEITAVRAERLQDISESDAKAEGAKCPGCESSEHEPCSYIRGYRYLWNSINGAGSWDANPWVWVIEFKRI